MKNTLRIIAPNGTVYRNARVLQKRMKSSLLKDKKVKDGKYQVVNHNGEVIGITKYEVIANGTYSGSKGKAKGHGKRRQRLRNSGQKYRVKGVFIPIKSK